MCRYNELPRKLFAFTHKGMWTIVKSDIIKMWLDLEQNVSKLTWQSQKNVIMAFYIAQQPYWGINVIAVSLDTSLLQVRDGMWFPRNERPDNAALWPIVFASKSLAGMETCCSNIEREALGILHDIEKFHHYCFTDEVSMITDGKQLVAIFKKDVASLSCRAQRLLCKYINKTYRCYASLGCSHWLQTGYPDTIKRQTEIKKYLACVLSLMQ